MTARTLLLACLALAACDETGTQTAGAMAPGGAPAPTLPGSPDATGGDVAAPDAWAPAPAQWVDDYPADPATALWCRSAGEPGGAPWTCAPKPVDVCCGFVVDAGDVLKLPDDGETRACLVTYCETRDGAVFVANSGTTQPHSAKASEVTCAQLGPSLWEAGPYGPPMHTSDDWPWAGCDD